MKVERAGIKEAFLKAGDETVERRTIIDPDFLADCEMADGQMRKRMAARNKGKPVKRPKELS